jgi:hypothetical protein
MIMSNKPLPQAIVDRIERGRAAEQARIEADERERQAKEAQIEHWVKEAEKACLALLDPDIRPFAERETFYCNDYTMQNPIWLYVIDCPGLLPIGIRIRIVKASGHNVFRDVLAYSPFLIHKVIKVYDPEEVRWLVTDLHDWSGQWWELTSCDNLDAALYQAQTGMDDYQALLAEVEQLNADLEAKAEEPDIITPEQQLKNVAQSILEKTEVERPNNGRNQPPTYTGRVDEIALAARHLAQIITLYLDGELKEIIVDEEVPF